MWSTTDFLAGQRTERIDRLDAAGQLAYAVAASGPASLADETHFRRAMENSMLTSMRALDLQSRITYVSSLCQIDRRTNELVGCTAPFRIGLNQELDMLMARLDDRLRGAHRRGF